MIENHGKSFALLSLIRIRYCGLGCCLEYLPPYSPDYNPIEQAFSVMKAYIARHSDHFKSAASPYYELYKVVQIITDDMSRGFFRHAGYNV